MPDMKAGKIAQQQNKRIQEVQAIQEGLAVLHLLQTTLAP